MNKNNNLGSDIPETTYDFIFESTGKISKKRYIGEFSCKITNTKEQCLISKHRAFLNGPNADFLDPGTLKIHMKISYLRYALTDYPKWWKESDLGYELLDHNVIDEIYEKVIDFEKSWLKEIWGDELDEKSDESKEGTDQAEA